MEYWRLSHDLSVNNLSENTKEKNHKEKDELIFNNKNSISLFVKETKTIFYKTQTTLLITKLK